MFSANYTLDRRCSVCNAPISDDNPDGIGYTCREVWRKAKNTAFYHFRGLDVWKIKSDFWAHLFVESFKSTKFRSAFKKSFFETVSKMIESDNIRLSRKMLNIIQSYLTGESDDGEMIYNYPKLTDNESEKAYHTINAKIRDCREQWINNANADEWEYITNLSKRYYNQERRTK